MGCLSLSLLGSFQAELNGRSLPLNSNPAKGLLIYLVMNQEKPHPREVLMELLWPGAMPRAAKANLRRALYLLRQALSSGSEAAACPLILADNQTIQIPPEAEVNLDVRAFEQFAKQAGSSSDCDALQQGIALYRGDFLSDFFLPDNAPFAEWVDMQRRDYRRQMLRLLDRLTAWHLANATWDKAEAAARQQLAMDNLRESAHRQLMAALAGNGRRRAALSHYETLCQLLLDELGINPSLATRELATSIRHGKHAAAAMLAQGPEMKTPTTAPIPHNLPEQAATFMGRELDLAHLAPLLTKPHTRLITVTGPGGIGKTQLAISLGHHLLEQQKGKEAAFQAGVYFAPLTALQAAEEIPAKIAQSVNLPLERGSWRSPREQVLDFLRHKHMLLILDNFEHLLEGSALVKEMLAAAPGLKLLVTSREALRLYEEQIYPLKGLPYPRKAAISSLDSAETYLAVQLFIRCARRVLPRFLLTAQNADDIDHLCRLVCGNPLAIELAASFVDSVPLPQIVVEIEQNIDFLKTDLRNVQERHRSMRAVFETSWRRLSDDERAVLPLLSVFRGGFTQEAAAQIAQANRPMLTRLVRRSLVLYDGENGRYSLHELLRQYAASQLAPSAEAKIKARHARYYCHQLQQQEHELKGGRQLEALALLEADRENEQMAWRWAAVHQDVALLNNTLESLAIWHEMRNFDEYGADACQTALESITADFPEWSLADRQTQFLLARLQAWQGYFLMQKNIPLAIAQVQSSHALLKGLSQSGMETHSETAFGYLILCRLVDHYSTGLDIAQKSLAHYKAADDQRGMSRALLEMGALANRLGKYRQAEKWFKKSLAICRQQGDKLGEARVLSWVGGNAANLGELAVGERMMDESIALLQELGIYGPVFMGDQANLFFMQGRFAESENIRHKTMAHHHHLGKINHEQVAKNMMAITKLMRGDYEQACLLAQECKDNLGFIGENIVATTGAFELTVLGAVALVQRHHQKAKMYLAESLKNLHRSTSFPPILGRASAIAAMAALWQDQPDEAEEHLQVVLELVSTFRDYTALIWALPAAALYLAKKEQGERALTIFALAKQEPFVANAQWFADVVGVPLAAVAAALPADTVAAAEARASELDKWETAVSLLQELTLP
ncbi:MAG: AAA family ATPase [Ardenticatenaceae bacterium]|nr:AAA family ATPase [Ardenticatenaceae bacterium]